MSTLSSTPSTTQSSKQSFVKEPLSETISQSNEIARDMDANRIPNDKEDPRSSTKALPFAMTNEQECEELIKSGEEPSFNQSIRRSNQSIDHNGNVLDRTMDQIRGWVQSFKSEPQYEEYEIEVDEDDQSSIKGSVNKSIEQASASANQAAASAKSTANQAAASAKQSAAQASESAKQTAAQMSESAKQTAAQASNKINQASESAKQTAAQVSESAKQTAAQASNKLGQASESAKQTAAQISESAKQTAAQASASAQSAAAQASTKLGQAKDSAAQSINQLSNTAAEQAKIAQSKLGSLKDQVVHSVSDLGTSVSQSISQYTSALPSSTGEVSEMANSSINSLKTTVNDFVSQYPSINQSINENMPSLPSSDQIRDYSSKMLPPLAQQASSSWAFAGSFLAQYMANMKEFVMTLRQQNAVLLTVTALTFVNHFVLPWFFLDKSAARSVIYSYVLASLAAHFTFFVSGHLRYQWLGHLLFVPMVMSLLFNQGFREAGDVAELIDAFKNGDKVGTAVAAPFSLRSYLFVIWMRGILMNQAVLGTFDLVNVMDLLGMNMNTHLGEEMPLIQGSVKNFRRSLAASVHGAADSLDVSAPAASHRAHPRKRRGSAQSTQPVQQASQQQRIQKSSSPAPQQQVHSAPQQHWVKKSTQSEESSVDQSSKMLSDKPSVVVNVHPKSDDAVRIESHERMSTELRQRHPAQSAQ